jgi:hypothetical protein
VTKESKESKTSKLVDEFSGSTDTLKNLDMIVTQSMKFNANIKDSTTKLPKISKLNEFQSKDNEENYLGRN